jgi:hypothetical protein
MKILAMIQSVSRREFLRGTARYGLLALMAGLTVSSLKNGRKQKCLNQGLCGGCSVFARCELPQAVSAKRAPGRG